MVAKVKEDKKVDEQANVEVNTEEQKIQDELTKAKQELEEQKQKADEYYDSLKRNMAEFDNYKKRMVKEKETLYMSILSDVIADLLPVIDNFEKAKDATCTDDTYKSGVTMIYNQLVELLKKQGVEKIADLGQTFDPELHEAVMSVQDETKGEKEIVEVLRSGYKLKDKVVRHSLVKVAN